MRSRRTVQAQRWAEAACEVPTGGMRSARLPHGLERKRAAPIRRREGRHRRVFRPHTRDWARFERAHGGRRLSQPHQAGARSRPLDVRRSGRSGVTFALGGVGGLRGATLSGPPHAARRPGAGPGGQRAPGRRFGRPLRVAADRAGGRRGTLGACLWIVASPVPRVREQAGQEDGAPVPGVILPP